MLLRTMLLMAGLLLAAPAAAEGRGPAKWGEGGLWEIYVDRPGATAASPRGSSSAAP